MPGATLEYKYDKYNFFELDIPCLSSSFPSLHPVFVSCLLYETLLVERSQLKARVSDDIKAFRERLRSAQTRPVAAQARVRDMSGYGGEPSCMGDSSTKKGCFPRRPLGEKTRDRPSTTDGLPPRQQVKTEKPPGPLGRLSMHPAPRQKVVGSMKRATQDRP